MTGYGTIVYDIDDTSIVTCEWGEWDGDVIPLTFTPISSGSTFVTVYIEDTDIEIVIDVSVYIPTPSQLSSLTVEGVGNEHMQYIGGNTNVNVIHSLTYEIITVGDKISIDIDYNVSCIECENYTGYIRIRYNLYNSSGVVVQTGLTLIPFTHTNTLYAAGFDFSLLPPDDYKLVFSDAY